MGNGEHKADILNQRLLKIQRFNIINVLFMCIIFVVYITTTLSLKKHDRFLGRHVCHETNLHREVVFLETANTHN
jgi:hypothetical protein